MATSGFSRHDPCWRSRELHNNGKQKYRKTQQSVGNIIAPFKYHIFKQMNYFSPSQFYSNYLTSYFSQRFELMCQQKNQGFIVDLESDWNIFVFIDSFINFLTSLKLDHESLKQTLKNNFLIPISEIHPDKIQTALANKSISTIIVNGLNQCYVPIVQLMLRLYLFQTCGVNQTKYEQLNRLVSDARIKANSLGGNHFYDLFRYILVMCLKRCRTKANLKIYRNLLDQNDLLDKFENQIQQVNERINESRNKSYYKQKQDSPRQEEEETKRHGSNFNMRTPPTKKKYLKSPKKLKQNFNIKQFLMESIIPNDEQIQKETSKRPRLSRASSNVFRTINQVSRKRFVPKKNTKLFNSQSAITSPTSLKTKSFQLSMKRQHSSLRMCDYHDDQYNGNRLVQETPVMRAKMSTPPIFHKSQANIPLNFDISPKKKTKRY